MSMQNQYHNFNFCVACGKRILYSKSGFANHKCDEKWEQRRHNIRNEADSHYYTECEALKIQEGLRIMEAQGIFG